VTVLGREVGLDFIALRRSIGYASGGGAAAPLTAAGNVLVPLLLGWPEARRRAGAGC
jgi:hypothetical protein